MSLDLTPDVQEAMRVARAQAHRAGVGHVEIRDLLFGLLEVSNCWATRFLRRAGIDLEALTAFVRREGVTDDARASAPGVGPSTEPDLELSFSPACEKLLDEAARINRETEGSGIISSGDIVYEMLFGDYVMGELLRSEFGLDGRRIDLAFKLMRLTPSRDDAADQVRYKAIAEFATGLRPATDRSGKRTVVGRDEETREAMKALSQVNRSSIVLVGEPGVGKTAIAHGLAERIARAPIGDPLCGSGMIGLNVPRMRTGVTYSDDFVRRLERVLEDVRQSGGRIILFVGSIRDFFNASTGYPGSRGIMEALIPLLEERAIRIVGTATQADFDEVIEGDRRRRKYFTPIEVKEPSIDVAVEMIMTIRPRYEEHHRVNFPDDAVRAAVELSVKRIPDQNLPEKAVDLMDAAMALKRPDLGSDEADRPSVTAEDIGSLVERRYGSAKQSDWTDTVNCEGVEARLRREVRGQDTATSRICQVLWRAHAGLNRPDAPVGVFLLLGPSGVGKTMVAKVLAEELFGDVERLIRVDMSEITHEADVSRLTGGSPNYVGYREGGQLTNAVKKNPRSIILLDEIEKAHPKAFDVLLQVFDDGRLTDGQGNVVDFTNTIIIMTSNLGSRGVADLRPISGENAGTWANEHGLPPVYERAIRWTFKTEFVNRIDDIVVFQPLYREARVVILENELNGLRERLAERRIAIEMSSDAKEWLLEQPSDVAKGARPLMRAFQRHVVDATSDGIVRDRFEPGSTVFVDVVDGGLTFHSVPRSVSE